MAKSNTVETRPVAERAGSGARRAEAYAIIKTRILDAEYQPGQALSEYQIAESLDVSRTPVREALKQLEQEGLIRSVPQKGVFVTELTVTDIDEIYQIREQLESLAARIAAVQMDEEQVKQLAGELKQARDAALDGRLNDAFAADVHLHKRLIALTRNRRLIHLLETLDDQVHRIRSLSPTIPGRLRATIDEHIEIVDALRRRDAEGASTAMRLHLQNARANAIRLSRPTSDEPLVR